MRCTLQSLVFAISLLFASHGLIAAEQRAEGAASTELAELKPAELFSKYCSVCHGDKGDGRSRARSGLNPHPRDFTSAVAWQELTRERMIHSVTHGRPDTAMVAWSTQLSSAQIEAVVDYIRDTFMRAPMQPQVTQQHSKDSATEPALSFAIIEKGQRIYIDNCAVCHGDKGSGARWTQQTLDPSPRDFTSLQTKAELTYARMISSVTHGRPDTAMMSFSKRLTTAEIEAVVTYVRAAFIDNQIVDSHRNAVTGGAAPAAQQHPHGQAVGADDVSHLAVAGQPDRANMSLPFMGGLNGDREAGRLFYMSNCIVCHGELGDGQGPRATSIFPKPRNFLSDGARRLLNRPVLFRAISHGKPASVMPAWSKVLSPQQIANVAEFVFQQYIQPPQLLDQASGMTQKKKAPLN
ncbi:MAG: c-type cytochrome [Gammaproteobacteria bacterium]|nr:c-type cytochrome [Gammaproteobacteria bacterium]